MKLSKYLAFQIVGWGVFACFSIYIANITHELTWKLFTFDIFLSLIGFSLTHLYRNYIKKQQWVFFNTEKIIFNCTIASILLSVIYNGIYFALLLGANLSKSPIMTINVLWGAFISMFLLFSIWNLFYFLWMYIEKSRKTQIETLKIEGMLKDIELKSLRANLQPHFIFNSLNNIRALVDENPEQARDAITKMSNILRSLITKQDLVDLLQNELNLVEDYLSLEKIRFEERLIFKKEIQAECLTVKIPTMMLQTLIENAIKHGISYKEEGGAISIKAFINQNFLNIEIENDIELNQQNVAHTHSLGFGLDSTKQRLKLLYNEKSSFQFEKKNDRAVVKIKIPINHQNDLK